MGKKIFLATVLFIIVMSGVSVVLMNNTEELEISKKIEYDYEKPIAGIALSLEAIY